MRYFKQSFTCPCNPRVTCIPLTCGQFLLSDWITCNPVAEGPNCPCAYIISSPTRLKSYILKFERPFMRGLDGSVRTRRQERLIRSNYYTCLSTACWLGYPANFMLRSIVTCASITASDIQTWASGSERATMPPIDWLSTSFQNLMRRSFSSCLALRRALTFSIISFIFISLARSSSSSRYLLILRDYSTLSFLYCSYLFLSSYYFIFFSSCCTLNFISYYSQVACFSSFSPMLGYL